MWEMLVWAWGGEILDRGERACLLHRPPAPDAIQWRADLSLKHGVVPGAQDLQGTNVRALFEQGRLAMHTNGNWALTDIEAAAQMPWRVAVVPRGKDGRWTLGSGAIYGAFKEARQHDAAWTLLSDLVVGEGMKTLAAESSMLPSVRPLIKQELLPRYKPEWLAAVTESSRAARQPHYNHPRYVEINAVFAEQLAPVWRGQRSARDAAEEIVRQVDPLLR
jgi:multiple sugar transport system substrate-binding protein